MRLSGSNSFAAGALLASAILAGVMPAAARVRHHATQQGYVQVVPAGPANIGPVPAATSPDWQPDYFGYVRGPSYGYGPLPYVPQFGGAPQGVHLAQNGNASCARFRSYDPASGTYFGRDGRRHACP